VIITLSSFVQMMAIKNPWSKGVFDWDTDQPDMIIKWIFYHDGLG
jgi:hypothetical protein